MADVGLLSQSSEKFSLKMWLGAFTLELECLSSTSGCFIRWLVTLADLLNLSVCGFPYV